MAFQNYAMTNLAQASLQTAISAGSTTIIVETGKGALFPTEFPFLCKIEHISGNLVQKREIVLITNRSGDTMTATRAFEPCPNAHDSSTQEQIARSFSSADVISLIATAKQMDELQKEVVLKLGKDELQDQSAITATDTGTATAYVITPTPAVTAYTTPMRFVFKATNANNGSATLKVGSGPAVLIKKMGGTSNLASGDIVGGQIVDVEYDGAFWQMQSQVAGESALETDGETITATAGEDITASSGNGACFIGTGNINTASIIQTTAADALNFGDVDARTRVAISFTPSATEKINALRSFTFGIRKVGNPTDIVEVRLVDSAKAPVSGWTTVNYSGAAFSTVFVLYTINQNASIVRGSKYYIEFRRQTAVDAVNYYQIQVGTVNVVTGYGTATYTGTTATWAADNENDAYYNIQYGYDITVGRAYLSDARYPTTARVDGLANTSALTGAIVKLKTDGIFNSTGLLPGYPYFLNNNGAWGIACGIIQRIVGDATTSTKMMLQTKISDSDAWSRNEAFGDGRDGDVTISTGTVTLTRDMYYNNLTITGGVLNPNGFSVYIRGVFTGTGGAIRRNGNNGATGVNSQSGQAGVGGVAGATLNQGTLNAETPAGNGGAGNYLGSGAQPATVTAANPSYVSMQGATGGNGTNNTGAVVTNTSLGATATRGALYNVFYASLHKIFEIFASATTRTANSNVVYPTGSYATYLSVPSSTGGVGGGGPNTGSAGSGGGAGGNAGAMRFVARVWNNVGTLIEAIGGNGAAGGTGSGGAFSAGGGGGGQGGLFMLFARTIISLGTITLTGGTGGASGGAPATAGENGKNGESIIVLI